MLEINLNKIVKNYGFKNILNDFNFEATTGERIALIGANGSGKTTVFKIIAGVESISEGNIAIRKGATIGLLNQIPALVSDNYTVRDVIIEGIQYIYDLETKMRNLELEMTENPSKLDSIVKSYFRVQEEFERVNGYELESKISKICAGFKINNMLDRTFNTLSGGEKTIVSLAALVLSEPSILLLDEPTNHLDIDTLEWFEDFLINYKGTVIISSHDRYFLDKVATKVVLIEKGKEEIFFGNYSYYLEENERRIIAEFNDFKNQQKQIEAMKNKIKQLQEWGRLADPNGGQFFKRAASIQKRLDKIEMLDKPDSQKEIPLDFQINNRSGKDVLVVKDLNITLGDKLIFNKANMSLKYGEKACLMGRNGSGKTTLIKAILNNEVNIGSNVTVGYIPQEISFEEDTTVLEISRKEFMGSETQLRASLAKFLFYGENVFKRVSKLSGGEKVRLKLFELIQHKANFLILDEPTNHIDIDTKEILEEALLEYKGTLLFISHDRYFINKLAKRIVYIENNNFKEYLGNYDYYRRKK